MDHAGAVVQLSHDEFFAALDAMTNTVITGPSTDQGLLIAKDHYERLGGYAPDARRSEARLLRQLGRSSRTLLRSRIMVA